MYYVSICIIVFYYILYYSLHVACTKNVGCTQNQIIFPKTHDTITTSTPDTIHSTNTKLGTTNTHIVEVHQYCIPTSNIILESGCRLKLH